MAGDQSIAHQSDYDRAMNHAAEVYADVLAALREAGYAAGMTQTGGMCLAIEINLGGGKTILVTDKHDILPWDRDDHDGWGIEMYVGVDAEQPAASLDWDDGSPDGLVAALKLVDIQSGLDSPLS